MAGTPTLVDAVAAAVFRHRDQAAVRGADGTVTTWAEVGREVRHLALGLEAAGVRPGQVVALAGGASPRLLAAELAVHAAGAISLVATPGETPPDGTRALDDAALDALLARGEAADRDRPAAFEELRGRVRPGDGATTADGVTLTHRHLAGALEALGRLLDAGPGERIAALAPWHVLPARVAGWYLAVWLGAETCLADPRDPGRIAASTAPTVAVGDATAWTSVAAAVRDHAGGSLSRRALRAARAAAAGERPTLGERAQRTVLGGAVQRRLRRDAGLARCRAGLVVGPPPGPATVRDLQAVGCPLVRVWGPPESAGLAVAGPLDPASPDTIGEPMAGVVVAVEPDAEGDRNGEVLLRGDRVVDGEGERWHPAGARGRLDSGGRLHLVGAGR